MCEAEEQLLRSVLQLLFIHKRLNENQQNTWRGRVPGYLVTALAAVVALTPDPSSSDSVGSGERNVLLMQHHHRHHLVTI